MLSEAEKGEMFNQAIDMPDALRSEALSISLKPEKIRYSLRIKPSDLSAVKKSSGLKFSSRIGSTVSTKGQSIYSLGPDEWLIIADPTLKERLSKVLQKIEKNYTVSVTDISHRNIGFEVSGPRAKRALNAGCPLDLSLEMFPVGKVTRTVFESAAIIAHDKRA